MAALGRKAGFRPQFRPTDIRSGRWRVIGESFHSVQQSLRGGIIYRVLRPIAAAWNGTSVGAFEKSAVLIVTLDAKTAFVYQYTIVSLSTAHLLLRRDIVAANLLITRMS